MKKEGISPLIGSVLLIAFVIILFVSITVWIRQSAVNPAMQETEEKVASDLESLNTKIGVSNVELDGDTVTVTITNFGSTEIKSFSVRVIGSDGVDVVPVYEGLEELETITEEVDFNLGKTGTVEKIEIIPVVSSGLAIGAGSGSEGIFVDISSCFTILQESSNSESGVYYIDPDGEGGNDPFDVYCDMDYDGGGWTLIGKGREGWAWNNLGRGTLIDLANNPDTNTIAYMPSIIIDTIIGKDVKDLSDGVRIYRYGVNQDWRFEYPIMNNWDWVMDTSKSAILISRTPDCSGTTSGNTVDTYWCDGGNNCNRIFTWAWGGHNYVKGWSAGSTCSCTDYGSDGWCYSSEGHVILRTQVWVRS